SLVYYGGEVKALPDGKIGGYLVLFTGPDDPDLSRDYFTKSTEFYVENGDKVPILYDHGLDRTIKKRLLGRATVSVDDAGVWAEGQLSLRDDYERKIYEMAKSGKLGWSSGAAAHLVERTPKGKSFHLDAWRIAEASLTPVPVEPRTMAVPLKSLAAEHLDLEDLLKSLEDERIEQSNDQPDLEGWSKLNEVVAPAQRKGSKAFSKAVEAAAEECFACNRQLGQVLKSHVTQLEHNAQLRLERDGRAPMSGPQQQHVAATRQFIAGMIEEWKSMDDSYARIQLLNERTSAEDQAASEQARHE